LTDVTQTPHYLLTRAFEMRNQWDEIVHDLALPKSHRDLTANNAAYYCDTGYAKNHKRARGKQALDLATEYLSIFYTKTRIK